MTPADPEKRRQSSATPHGHLLLQATGAATFPERQIITNWCSRSIRPGLSTADVGPETCGAA